MNKKFDYKSTFFVVATPIGNLADISFRAVETLISVDLIACEDTRESRKLLNKFEIKTPSISYHKFSNQKKEEYFLQQLQMGKNIALVSDAGTPLIADPGMSLLNFLRDKGIKIEVIPGACSIINALVLAGVNTADFVFAGWMPRKSSQRIKVLEKFLTVSKTVVFLESPHRIEKSINVLAENLAEEMQVFIVREMTKIYQEVLSGSAKELIEILKTRKLKGEIVLICSK